MLKQISSNDEFIVGRYYHCFTKKTKEHSIELCQASDNYKFFGRRLWAADDNNQALERWDFFGPIEVPNI